VRATGDLLLREPGKEHVEDHAGGPPTWWTLPTTYTTSRDANDVQEGLDAAAAVGDDRLQREAGQRVNPDAFTHGSSQQRTDAFNTGFESGSPSDCGV
jgi:predicted metalloprotease